jgi:prepilin-type processing-associated H-X9-DG protein
MTLVELVVVIAILGLLAALMLPAFPRAKVTSKQTSCLANLWQLDLAFQMYASDNGGHLAQNVAFEPQHNPAFGTNSWVYGNMKNQSDATNALLLQGGEQFPYTPQPAAFRCPADFVLGNGLPRVRSYAMNSWIGSAEMEAQEEETPFRVFLKESDLAAGRPSAIWVLIDEHTATLDDGWFGVTMNDRQPFAEMPATRHQNGYGLNFADGHAEIYHLRTSVTQIAETQAAAVAEPYAPPGITATNTDWLKLKQVTTSP